MKIFITGGTGFIGKHLVRRLARSNHQMRCLVRPTSDVRLLQALGVETVEGHVLDREALLAGMQGCDWLFHLANLYTMWVPDRSKFWQVNVDGTRMVMECALEVGIKKVINISTVAVYGKPGDDPIREDSQPSERLFSDYGRTKSLGDQIAWELHRTRGLPLVTIYPGIVLGAGDDRPSGQYIKDVICKRVPSIIFCRSYETYVYVGDVVEMILRAAEKPDNIGEKYFAGKFQMNGREYANLISQISGVRLPWPPYPDFVVMAASYLLTWLAHFTHRAPHWGLSIDAGWTLRNGFRMDGSKAERELGIEYTPVQYALQEAINFYRGETCQPMEGNFD